MKQKDLAVAATLLGLASPAAASLNEWNFCSGTSLNVCMNFTLTQVSSSDYQLTFKYASTNAPAGQQGFMTAAGLYRAKNGADLDVRNLSIVAVHPSVASWSINQQGLSGGGPVALEIGAGADRGVSNGLPVGGWITIGFTSDNLATYDMSGLFARAHVQSFGPDDCSLKPDSDQGVLDGITAVNERCGYASPPPATTEVAPEPITMVLLGSGLLGVGAARLRRRKQRGDLA